MTFRPLDIDYPTNYPGGTEIPVPSGIWLDMVRELGEDGDLPFLVRTNQSWAWTGSRTNLSTAPASFEPAKFTTAFTGYRNPVTTADRYDTSTIGLQIVPQLAGVATPEPVMIPIPVKHVGTYLKASITVVCENGTQSDRGVIFSMGFAGVNSEGNPLYIPPSSFSGLYDTAQAVPRDAIFNINPDLLFNDNLKYIISFLPGSGLDFRLRLVDLTIIDERLDGATGCVLISCAGIPSGFPLAGQADLAYGSSWEFLPKDPNHILLKHNGVRYEDLFSDRPGSANGTTGAKQPWMLYIRDGRDGRYLFTSALQVRPEGDRVSQNGYNVARARVMIHPFIPNDVMALPSYNNWLLSIHRMPLVIITGITIRSRLGATILPIGDYSSGVRARADAVNTLGQTINKGITAPISVSSNYNRVKGTQTVGSLCDEVILEKNEITPWSFYDPVTTYGAGVIPGEQLTSSFSTFELKGHNSALAYSIISTITPKQSDIVNLASSFRVDFTINGDDENRGYPVRYLIPVYLNGRGSYDDSLDPSIRTMPLDTSLLEVALINGNEESVLRAAASFSPMGLVDCYYNLNLPQAYRPGLASVPYPIIDASSLFLRASGFINNYGSAGGITGDAAQWIFGQPLGQSDFNLPYDITESVVDRGAMLVLGLAGAAPDLTTIDTGTIFFSHAHIVYLTYTPEFP